MPERNSISLFLYIPEKHVIVLGVRASQESYPHLLQATCHGTIEDGEDHADAIERELKEETTLNLPDIGPLTFLGELAAGQKQHEKCSYYLASITEKNAKKIQPTAEVGRFIFIAQEEAGMMTPWSVAETKHIDSSHSNVIFDDELEALTMAFELLDEHEWNLVPA